MKKKVLILFFFSVTSIVCNQLQSLIVGSKSNASTQAFVLFPSVDNNNTLLGFASFDNGFSLLDELTTATFDNFMPVSGAVGLNRGRLTLRQDFVLANISYLLSGGVVEGNNHAIKLPPQLTTFRMPLLDCKSFELVANLPLELDALSDLRSVDWAFDDAYLVAGQRSVTGDELKIVYFDGSTLTTTNSVGFNREVTSVRWHPTERYVAVGLASGSGDDVKVYQHNVHNGTFVETGGNGISGSANAVAWHPSGSYLVVGTDVDTQEIIVYSVTSGALGASSIVNLSSNQNVNRDAISFSPGGNQLVFGVTNNSGAGVSELLVYNFSFPASLTLTTSRDLGNNVQAVDWSPTGSYVAVGLTGSSANVRLYDVSSGKLLELPNARQNETRDVYGVHWHPSGDYLAVCVNTGLNNELFIYLFDKETGSLVYLTGIESTDEIWTTRWSRSGNYIAYDYEDNVLRNRLDVSGFITTDCDFIFDNLVLECNSNLDIAANINFKGTCRINGKGKSLALLDESNIIVRPNGHLIIENCLLSNLKGTQLRCLLNNSRITLRNCELSFDQDFTFSQGSLIIEEDVVLSGTNTFHYTTPVTSTIVHDSTLFIETGMTFKYNPAFPSKELLFMEDGTSRLYLDGCSLHSTATGLSLAGGILVIDNDVTLSSEALTYSQGLSLNNNLDIQIRGGATLDLHGHITYD